MDTTDEYFRRLPLMLGIKQVQDCLGIKRATIYRRLDDGSMRPPVKIGSTNRWHKDYIRRVIEKGFEPRGSYSWPSRSDRDGGEGAPTAP